jgi:hypothetical protein
LVEKKNIKPRDVETEIFEWTCFSAIKHDVTLMPNLKVLILIMQAGLTGWDMEVGALDTYTIRGL